MYYKYKYYQTFRRTFRRRKQSLKTCRVCLLRVSHVHNLSTALGTQGILSDLNKTNKIKNLEWENTWCLLKKGVVRLCTQALPGIIYRVQS